MNRIADQASGVAASDSPVVRHNCASLRIPIMASAGTRPTTGVRYRPRATHAASRAGLVEMSNMGDGFS
ncbi:hypothetical protein [Dokdonella fugitiva]|uniref:hypothetical protein n=1 Tax=Dokdonella fugitiva TaxID=328517 RepID=UPI0015FA4F10|nr:hypothetical protein [Dokdonella fugitiva]MBA8883338.1 hypothetical protein [Dokdonella fugitiva]